MSRFYVYFLRDGRRSYIGFTVDVFRRLRQHRGELAGGARYTKSWRNPPQLVAYISGFPTNRIALSYEWHAKRMRRGTVALPGAHPRFGKFLAALRHEKFAPLRADLRVHLCGHPELKEDIERHFDVEVVV